MNQLDIIKNADKIRDNLIEIATKPVGNENEQQKAIRKAKKKIYENWVISELSWDEFIKTLSENDKNIIGLNKDNKKSFKMPTWGWVAIGVGSLAVLALVITLGIKASRKAKAA